MRHVLTVCAIAMLVTFCPQYEAQPLSNRSSDANVVPLNRVEVGIASWYGQEFQGNVTASGELFDEARLTAAHLRLPLGTRIRVTNLRNRRSVVLKVNDRGPHVPGRFLDVSRAAAERLGFQAAGKAAVRIRVLSFPRGYVARGIRLSSLSTRCVRPAG
jgi:rare lipoprotein A